MKPKKWITRKLKALGHEAMSLVEYIVSESIARKNGLAYRLKVPYRTLAPNDKSNEGNVVIEVSVYFDSDFKEEVNERLKNLQITGPDKGRH